MENLTNCLPDKIWKYMFSMVCVLWLFTSISENAHAKDTILWLNDAMPPAFISHGPDKGNGIVDGVVKIYKEHLPEYEHSHLEANMPRILDLMRKGDKVCYAGFFRTPEREKFVSFSIPNLINYMGAIVIKKSQRKALFSNAKTLLLGNILENDTLIAGFTNGRSYGKIIDTLIEKNKNTNKTMIFRSGQNSIQGLLEMLSNKRIDYTIGFPWEIPYVANQIGKTDEFGIMYIEEGKDSRGIKNYIGCPNNEWGKKLIQKVNKILIQVRPTRGHMEYQLKWFPKDIETDIRRAYQDQIITIIE